jgi:hypothetical protein
MSDKTGKKPYEPPRIVRVKLAADEMAVANCKSVRVGPAGSNVCNNGGVLVNKTIGS